MTRPTLRYKLAQTAGKWFFKIQSRNGNTLIKSFPYKRRGNALKTLNLLKPSYAPIEE